MLRNAMLLALAWVLVLGSAPAVASVLEEEMLKDAGDLYVYVDDQVKDGCLPSPDTLRTKAELILRSAGIQIISEFSGGSYLRLFALGGSRGSLQCAGLLDVSLFQPVQTRYGPKFVETYWGAVVTTSPPAEFQRDKLQALDQFVSDLANEILKARQQ